MATNCEEIVNILCQLLKGSGATLVKLASTTGGYLLPAGYTAASIGSIHYAVMYKGLVYDAFTLLNGSISGGATFAAYTKMFQTVGGGVVEGAIEVTKGLPCP